MEEAPRATEAMALRIILRDVLYILRTTFDEHALIIRSLLTQECCCMRLSYTCCFIIARRSGGG